MPSTKRTGPAKSQAEQKNVSPPPSPAQQSDLPETVDMIIDAVSEMLTHGGNLEDVDRLIQAAMAHTKRRQVSGIFDDKPEEIPKLVTRFIESRQADWKSDLLLVWRKNRRSDHPSFEPTTISGRLRLQAREVAMSRFDEFMRDGTPEEVRLMANILNTRDGGVATPIAGVDEIPLGEAFAYELDRNDTYIRVPKGLRQPVQRYIDALNAIENKAVA